MLNCGSFYEHMRECGISFFTGVPDSLLKDICAYISDHAPSEKHIIAANEGGAVGLAIGHFLATGKPGLVYMQNSGQGNAVNPLMSLADKEVYGIPMLLLVGWRGEPGVKDEPQHVKQGKITKELFDAMGIPCVVLPDSDEDAFRVVEESIEQTLALNQPVALLVRSGTFASYKLQGKVANQYLLSREESIGAIASALDPKTVVVSTTGKPSRELYEYRESQESGHSMDFLTVGGMGHASQIALGIALAKPDRTVCCLDGDGAALMHMGGLGIVSSQMAPNYKHILLNNGVHDSVGGQPTVGFAVDFCSIARSVGYPQAYRAETRAELDNLLPRFVEEAGPVFLEVRIASGARDDLGRPKSTPAENKAALMEFING